MDVSKIISISRKQTNTSVSQISDADYLEYLNITYKDIFSRLTVNSKKYTWNTFVADLVDGQSEYSLPIPSTTETGVKLVLDVFVDYGDGYIKCKIYDSYVDIDSDETLPYVIQRDGSIFLSPTPGSGKLKVEGKYIPIDLETTTVSASIKLPAEYHDVMISGLNYWVFGEKQLFDKQGLQKQNYEEGVKRIQVEGAMDIESAYEDKNEIDFSSLE